MNILNTVIIFAILLTFVAASEDSMEAFKEAVENSNLETAVKIFQGGEASFQSDGIKHAIQRGDPDFIVRFIKRVKATDKAALIMILTDCSLDVMKQIIEHVDFPKRNLLRAASEPSVFCSQEKINYLFGKMDHFGGLTCLIQSGIMNLFRRNRTDSLPMILKLLEGRISSDSNLHNVAIQTIFVEAAEAHSYAWIDYCEWHPAIDARTYGDALVYAWKTKPQSPFFMRLLANAGKNDLEAALYSPKNRQPDKFYVTIRNALPEADFGYNRINLHVMTAWVSRKILDEDVNIGMPEVITDMIVSYITEWRLPTRKSVTKDKHVGCELIGAQHERVMLLNVQLSELLEGLINEGHYGTLRVIGTTMNVSQLRKYIFPSITKIEHYKEFCKCLTNNGLLGDFFAYVLGEIGSEMAGRVEDDDESYPPSPASSTVSYPAIADGSHGRIACSLMSPERQCEMEKAELAAREKISDLFQILEVVIGDMEIRKCIPAIKRFLVIHGNELEKRHLITYRTFYEMLGRKIDGILVCSLVGRAFLTDLARQPIPISLSDFIKGFTRTDTRTARYFDGLNWRECMSEWMFAVEERGRARWATLTQAYPTKYAGGYPFTDEARKAFLRKFTSKQDWDEEWVEEMQEKSTIVLERLEQDALNLFPKVLLPIIAIYTVEWI